MLVSENLVQRRFSKENRSNLLYIFDLVPWFSAEVGPLTLFPDILQCLKTCLVVTTAVPRVATRDTVKHPTMHRVASTRKNYLAQNVNNAETKKASLILPPCCAVLAAHLCPVLCDPMDCSLPGFSVCGDSPGKNTGVRCHVLLQRIFPTQGLNPSLPHCRQIL